MKKESVPLLRSLITLAAVFAAGAVGLMLPSAGAHPTLPLLSSGIAVAACIRWGRRLWPAILAAGVGIDLWMRQPPIASLGVGIGIAGGSPARGCWSGGFRRGLRARADVPLFIVSAALGTMWIPTLGLIGFRLSGDSSAMTDPLRWIRWWSNTTAGVLLVGPMLVAVNRRSLARFTAQWAEGALWLLGVTFCIIGVLSFDRSGVGRPLVVMIAFFMIVVGAIRLGLVVAAFGALLLSVAAG